MNFIDRNTAKLTVKKSLQEVTDFSGDIENFTFTHFHDFHKKIFINSLKVFVNQIPCSDHTGNISNNEYFDVDLSISLLNSWNKIGDAIDYIANSHYRESGTTKKIQL